HRIEKSVQLRDQAETVFSYDPGRFLSSLVILEALLDRQSCHADVNAWLCWLAIRVQTQDRWIVVSIAVIVSSFFGCETFEISELATADALWIRNMGYERLAPG